jgi:molybdopterin molybdotransferase
MAGEVAPGTVGPMIPLDEALATVLAGCRALSPEIVPLADAAGCVLAEDVVAPGPIPPFDNSAMDGYAVRVADVTTVPVRLPVVAEVAAGHPADQALAPGQAMRIFTGAPVPEGADAVVIVERTERLDGGAVVEIREPAVPGAHIRLAGDDLQPGDPVAAAGDELTPGRIGVLRSVGRVEVVAHPRPRVGVLCTGDELVEDDRPLRPGEIYDSNRPTILAMVAAAGGVPVDLGRAPDDEEALHRAVVAAFSHCDLLLTTGGVSMGDTDMVKVVLARYGEAGAAEVRWMQVSIRPAKPLGFGVLDPRRIAFDADRSGLPERFPMIGLPGNPVSSMVSFELFARPALRRLAGHRDDRLSRVPLAAAAGEALERRPDGKIHYVRVTAEVVDGALHVRPLRGQGSHQLSAMARADGLAVLPDGPGVAAGDRVDVLLLGDPTP